MSDIKSFVFKRHSAFWTNLCLFTTKVSIEDIPTIPNYQNIPSICIYQFLWEVLDALMQTVRVFTQQKAITKQECVPFIFFLENI